MGVAGLKFTQLQYNKTFHVFQIVLGVMDITQVSSARSETLKVKQDKQVS